MILNGDEEMKHEIAAVLQICKRRSQASLASKQKNKKSKKKKNV